MDDQMVTVLMGAIALIGSLMVLLLGWLHIRLNAIEKKQDGRMRELYQHLDRTYQRRDMAAAENQTNSVRIDNLNTRVDQVYAMLHKPSKDGEHYP